MSCGKSVKYRFIEFFVFDYDSLPYLLCFCGGVDPFPLVALDRIILVSASGPSSTHTYVNRYSLLSSYSSLSKLFQVRRERQIFEVKVLFNL